jgi:predicted ATPase/serine/threonine protein kinase/DNA-binding CsgD family transcriptional regulator
MHDHVGEQLGNYRVLRLLGRGGSASVYLGEHVYLKSQAALKVLHTQLTDQDATRFVTEAQTLAHLSHPHIVRVLDFAVQDGTPFLVMEHAPHGNLRQRHPPGSLLPIESIVAYVQQVAAALQHAHDQRLLHRDVKPENMLLDARFEVLLGDFGLAMFTPHTLSMSTQSADQPMAGTVSYLAPEQAQGKPRPASDQYALGVVVYEWLCGSRPFSGSPIEIAMQHLTASPPPLHDRVPDLPPVIEEVVLRALAKEPKLRFASVLDFATALKEASLVIPVYVSIPQLDPSRLSVAEPGVRAQDRLASVEPPATTASGPSTGPQELQYATLDIPRPEPVWKVPTVLTPLIGREQLVSDICTLFSRPEVRLLTLLGTGGIGKSRVAIQVANELRYAFADGVCFIPLAKISDPTLVIPAVAQELGIQEQQERPVFEQVKMWLRAKQFLLLLDNFEQVVIAAPLIEELYASCPLLKVMVTSRAVLDVQGEQEFPVPPLALPDLQKLSEDWTISPPAAVTLFVQRAQATLPAFQLTQTNAHAIAEICVRLDGLPLAIELAAARIKLLPPHSLLARLSQRFQVLSSGAQTLPERQQTLRNTLKWSYDLLHNREQQIFRQLSIFVGGCSLEAAEAVCIDLENQETDVLNTVASLIDKSLVQQGELEAEEPRLVLLETVREYGLECLRESGETELMQRAHAEYYLALAERVEPHLRGGGEQLKWLTELNREQENFRAALRWFVESEETELALRLCGALWWYWFMRGNYKEALHWLEAALALPMIGGQTAARAQVLCAAGVMNHTLGELDKAQNLIEESMALYNELGDTRGYAHALQMLAWVHADRGDYTMARNLTEQGLALCRELGDAWNVALGLNDLATIMWVTGDGGAARTLWEECIVLCEELGETWALPRTLYYLAQMELTQGNYDQAVTLFQKAAVIAREMGDMKMLPWLLAMLAEIVRRDDDVQATRLIREGLAIAREMGDLDAISYYQYLIGDIARSKGNAREANEHFREGLSLANKLTIANVTAGKCLLGLARIASTEGRFGEGARLFAAAEERLNLNVDMLPLERTEYEHDLAGIRAKLSKQEFAAAWAEGHAMTLEQVLAVQESVSLSQSLSSGPTAITPPSAMSYPAGLTARELEILRLVAQGMTDAQVAEKLIISPRTVNWHLTSIYGKIGVSSRSAATRYAIEQRLV